MYWFSRTTGSAPLRRRWMASIVCLLGIASAGAAAQRQFSKIDRERGVAMLRDIKKDLQKHYYDSNFRGLDLTARFRAAEEAVKASQSTSEMFARIADTLLELNDSHTWFVPPERSVRVEYGWRTIAVGDAVYISQVKPDSDAQKKGLARGDQLIALNGQPVTRANLWKLNYLYRVLRPQRLQHLDVRSPGGAGRTVDVESAVDRRGVPDLQSLIVSIEHGMDAMRDRSAVVGRLAFIWKMAGFTGEEQQVDGMMSKARAFPVLILDLRGNGGGAVTTMCELIGAFFEKDVLVGTQHRRAKQEKLIAKASRQPFRGRVIVLVDSASASASEAVSRVLQIEQRGDVLGDRTAGAVMESIGIAHQNGAVDPIAFGVSVTVVDLRMTDGGSLEHNGVKPDEIMLPTPADMAAGRDPVLARAIQAAGGSMTPEEAGRLFPLEWER